MNNNKIRNYIEIASTMITENEQVVREDIVLTENSVVIPAIDAETENQISTLAFKLRSYRDPDPGEYADGVEAGMARAADMIENMLDRLRGN